MSFWEHLSTITIIAGLASIIFIESIFLDTFISISTLLIIMGVASLFVTTILFILKPHSFTSIGDGIETLIFNFVGMGSLCCLLFLWIYFNYTDKVRRVKLYEIVLVVGLESRRFINGKRHYGVRVKIGPSTKKVYVQTRYISKVEKAKNVDMSIEKGYFNFDVIKARSLR